MDRLQRTGARARAFLWGDYGGAPVDYLMAVAMVYAIMVVLVARNIIALF